VKLVLASRSPQRREILARLGIEFEAVTPEIEELREGEPELIVVENGRRKAHSVNRPDVLVLGCDTEVVLEGQLLGKPGNVGEARAYLARLSGRQHEVLSGLVLVGRGEGQERSGVARSSVTFHRLSAEEIERYLRSGEWRERAGGYAIQGLGATLVAGVEGDVANVIGLPVSLLLELAPELEPRRADVGDIEAL
jgi:septum formation protein